MRGLLPLLVLNVLKDGPSYGYAISSTLAQHGLSGVKGGALYPLLARQEAAGLVMAQWRAGNGGPGRKYFALTSVGVREVARLAEEWQQLVETIEKLMSPEGGPQWRLISGSCASRESSRAANSQAAYVTRSRTFASTSETPAETRMTHSATLSLTRLP